MNAPRVALFPDSFLEVNGVAHTFRHFAAYAEEHELPLLCVHAGADSAHTLPRSHGVTQRGSVQFLALPRSPWTFRLERDLHFDPFFARHAARIGRALRSFRPDVIHISGPSELGIAGAYFAWKLGVPLAASWHTNLHEYAAQRLPRWMRASRFGHWLEAQTAAAAFHALTRFYRLGRMLYAPNAELCSTLEQHTGRPCRLMGRGVDTTLFTPARRERYPHDEPMLGYVGRFSVEKNVALLPRVHAELRRHGLHVRWLIVGQGEQEALLRRELGRAATFTGVLRGAYLAAAYAAMDLFVFPSATDTFGNVVLEALASGVPAVVTPHGGPAHIVADGVSGRIAREADFASAIANLLADTAARSAMSNKARQEALRWSWQAVFEDVYRGYELLLQDARRMRTPRDVRFDARPAEAANQRPCVSSPRKMLCGGSVRRALDITSGPVSPGSSERSSPARR